MVKPQQGDEEDPSLEDISAKEVDQEVLSIFWNLASIDESERLKSASSLVQHLQKAQKEFKKGKVDDGATHSNLDVALRHCAPLTTYCIQRLVKGLTSSRHGARQGFSLALTAVLQNVDCLKSQDIPPFIDALQDLTLGGGRDELFGHLFGLGAIIRSKISINTDIATIIIHRVLSLASQKSFLRESAAALILEMAQSNPPPFIQKALSQSESLQEWLTEPIETSSPEALAVAVQLWQYMPKEMSEKCPLLPSKCDKPSAAAFLTPHHLTSILSILRPTTACHPRMNIAWTTLLKLLLPAMTDGTNTEYVDVDVDADQLTAFWTILVEKDIFQSASHGRKYLGFTLFNTLASSLKAKYTIILLSANFLRSLSNNISKKNSLLHAVAQQSIDTLSRAFQRADQATKAALVDALSNQKGGFGLVKLIDNNRDNTTKKGLDGIRTEIDEKKSIDDFKQLIKEFDAASLSSEGSNRQKWVLGQLSSSIKDKHSTPAVIQETIVFLLKQGLFLDPNNASTSMDGIDEEDSRDIRRQCTSQLISAIGILSKPRPRSSAESTKDIDYVVFAAENAGKLQKNGVFELILPPTSESESMLETLRSLRLRIVKSLANSNPTSAIESRKLLDSLKHLVCILELYTLAKPLTADADLATDLDRIYTDKFETKTPKSQSKKQKGGRAAANNNDNEGVDMNEDGIYWADALLGIVLTMLSRNETPLPSAPLRDAAERAFKSFAGDLTLTGLQDLVEVVTRSFDHKEVVGDEEEDGLEEEDEGNDDSEGEDEDDESEEEEEEEGNDDSEEEQEEEEEDDDNDEEMDDIPDATDEHMFKMDDQLAAFFALARTGRDTKQNHQDSINFKLRALACLEAFMKKVPQSPLIVTLPGPLLTALVAALKPSGDRVVAERLSGVIKHQFSRCRVEGVVDTIPAAAANNDGGDSDNDNDTPAISRETEMRLQLRRSLYYASRSENKAVLDAAALVYAFLLKATYSDSNSPAIRAVAEESAAAAIADVFDKKKTRLHRPFFQLLFQRVPSVAVFALPSLLEHAISSRNEYLQLEAFNLVSIAVRAAVVADQASVVSVLKKSGAKVAEILIYCVNGEFSKAQRRVEAIKALCSAGQALQSHGSSLGEVLGAKEKSKVLHAIEAKEGKDAHLMRLEAFLSAKKDAKAEKRRGTGEVRASKVQQKRKKAS